MKILILLLAILCWASIITCHSSSEIETKSKDGLQEIYHWGIVEYKFPNASIRQQAIASGSYIPANNAMISIAVSRLRIFVSVFRFKLGIASSLNYFVMNATKSPVLIPYPSFDDNYINEDRLEQTLSLNSEKSIICAGYIQIDQCDRLWTVDNGYTDYLGTRRVIASPAVVVIDLKTNLVLRRYTLPTEFLNSNSVFINLIVDCGGSSCGEAFAYIADAFRSLIVYSYKTNTSWRLTHDYFGSDPDSGNFWFGKINLQYNYGIFGLMVGEFNDDGSRRVYITPFASTKTFFISNSVLQNETYVELNQYFNDVHYLGDRGKNSQIYTMTFDEQTCVMFETEFYRAQIECWNTGARFARANFGTVYKSKKSFFPLDSQIDANRNLWVLASRIPTFLTCTWNAQARNMQIFKQNVDKAIHGTVCSEPNHKP